MSEMVERVAKSVEFADDEYVANYAGDGDIDVICARASPGWAQALTRAAIEAMREPTMHMKQEAGDSIVVGCCNLQLRDARDVWTVMIDAALPDEAP